MANLCNECGEDLKDEYSYMLTKEVWQKVAKDNPKGFLCFGCLENRLGRKLKISDLANAMINNLYWTRSPRMDARWAEFRKELGVNAS